MTRVLTYSALVLSLNVCCHPGQSGNIGHSTWEGSVAGWTERSQNGGVQPASRLPLITMAPCSRGDN